MMQADHGSFSRWHNQPLWQRETGACAIAGQTPTFGPGEHLQHPVPLGDAFLLFQLLAGADGGLNSFLF